jgi:MoxR-like ATPase
MPEFDLINFEGATVPDEALNQRLQRIGHFVQSHAEMASSYQPSRELLTAVNVALSLGRPLLLTGEPGCGKTQAAWWIANKLGLTKSLYEFRVKSDSRARDLLYRFDAASWFRAAQLNNDPNVTIDKSSFLTPGPLGLAFGWKGAKADRPAVVLIDEIDKAPRDFPNDLLHELDQMSYHIDETNQDVVCPPQARPIIVITSNAERRLPDPFLRRCITHRIDIASVVPKILRARLGAIDAPNEDLLAAGAEFWNSLSAISLSRKPSIDEFWRWLALLIQSGGQNPADIAVALKDRRDRLHALPAIGALFSTEADLKRVIESRA